MNGVGARHDQAQNGVSAFVICHPFLVRLAKDDGALRPENDLLERVHEVFVMDLVLLAARGQERHFVHEVPDVSPGDAGGRLGDAAKVDVVGERYFAGVDLEDGLAAILIGQVDDHSTVEPARAQKRPVENVRLVGRSKHDDPLAA